jgi:hypothetical protein
MEKMLMTKELAKGFRLCVAALFALGVALPSLAEAGAATGLGAGSLPAATSLVTEVKDKGKDKKVVVKKNVYVKKDVHVKNVVGKQGRQELVREALEPRALLRQRHCRHGTWDVHCDGRRGGACSACSQSRLVLDEPGAKPRLLGLLLLGSFFEARPASL